MGNIEREIMCNPAGAVSDIENRVSYYWIFEERLTGDSKSSIHVMKIKNETALYESASVLIRFSDVLKCLSSQSERQIRRVVYDK